MREIEDAAELIEVVVENVRLHVPSGQHFLMLRERGGDRLLPISVGPLEANAAAMHLHGMVPPRPITHDLLATMLERSGTVIERVIVTRLAEEVFYASIHLRGQAGVEEIDARPSDAINVALRTGSPVLVAAGAMDERAVLRTDQGEMPVPPMVQAIAVDVETGKELGVVRLPKVPEPGEQIEVPMPTACRVVSVEPATGEKPPRVVVGRV